MSASDIRGLPAYRCAHAGYGNAIIPGAATHGAPATADHVPLTAGISTGGEGCTWAADGNRLCLKIPAGQGIWPAFWMLGQDIGTVGWPTCGEIDIMENVGFEPGKVHGSMHGPGYFGAPA